MIMMMMVVTTMKMMMVTKVKDPMHWMVVFLVMFSLE